MKSRIAVLCVLGTAAFSASAQVSRAVSDVPVNSIRWESGMPAARLAPSSTSPLLTDRHTAESHNLPYTVLQGGIVMVPADAAAKVRLPAVTVVPSDVSTAQVSAPSTAVMGAGPAPQAGGETVITELRNPPITIVQRGKNVAVTQR